MQTLLLIKTEIDDLPKQAFALERKKKIRKLRCMNKRSNS